MEITQKCVELSRQNVSFHFLFEPQSFVLYPFKQNTLLKREKKSNFPLNHFTFIIFIYSCDMR